MVSVNIMLGTACNWKCPYCLQEVEKGWNTKHDVQKFCSSLDRYLTTNNIQIKRVAYWGGEPCLYWPSIKAVEEVIDKHTPLKPSRFITNGSLLTTDDVHYLNERQMLVNVSYHDGQLDDQQWRICMGIRNLYVTSLVHHKQLGWQPYREKWEYLWNKFGRCINWFVYPIHYTNGLPSDYAFTLEDVDQYMEYLYSIVPLAYTDVFYSRMLEILFYDYYQHDWFEDDLSFCYNSHVLSIDLEGNQYYCHHDCTKSNIVGNIFNPLSIKDESFICNLRAHRQQCKACVAYPDCLGGCFRDQSPQISCYMKLKMRDLLLWIKREHSTLVAPKYMEYL